MFTGLIQTVGVVKSFNLTNLGAKISIHAPQIIDKIQVDDSVCVEGICLTATQIHRDQSSFTADIVSTTLEKSFFKNLKINTAVNLELALTLSDRLGGHLVQGHVTGIGTIQKIEKVAHHHLFTFSAIEEIFKYLIDEASIAVSGVSLTIAHIDRSACNFTVAVIPHTFENTTLSQRKVFDVVNLEVDVLAKYLWNFTQNCNQKTSPLNQQKLFDWLQNS